MFSKFSDCIEADGGWHRDGSTVKLSDLPSKPELLDGWVPAAEVLGLIINKADTGRWDPDIRNHVMDGDLGLPKQTLYALARPDGVVDGCVRLICAIRLRHGAGRVWFIADPNVLARKRFTDDGLVDLRAQGLDRNASTYTDPQVYDFDYTGDRSHRILMGCYYFHEGAK